MPSPVPVLLTATAFLGCAALRPLPADPAGTFTFRNRYETVDARLDREGLFGRTVGVWQDAGDYRGGASGRRIYLSSRGRHLVGLVGDSSADLEVEAGPDLLSVRGRLGTERAELALSATRLVGRIGTCVYDLGRADDRDPWYRGQMAYGLSGPLQLRIPARLQARPPLERGAYLTFFLMGLCGFPDKVT